jgi:methylated-DNA-[protein]-cysteine S-methyltransferase
MPKIIVLPFTGYYSSPIGLLQIKNTQTHICEISFVDKITTPSFKTNSLTENCIHQLDEYFNGKQNAFDLNLLQDGTLFQQQVWQQVCAIDYGKTSSYLTVAKLLGDENLTRAVGTANAKNKIAIVVPCHRVIGSDGNLTGYAWGLKRKQWLLDYEAKISGTYQKLF